MQLVESFVNSRPIRYTREKRDKLALQATELCQPMFEKQVSRGHLSPERAAKLTQSLLQGDLEVFPRAFVTGFLTNWVIEKPLVTAAIALTLLQPEPNHTVLEALGYIGITNIAAFVPFAFLATKEYADKKKQIQEEDISDLRKRGKLLLTGSCLVLADLLNLTPASIFATPALIAPRNLDFALVMIRHQFDNAVEKFQKPH